MPLIEWEEQYSVGIETADNHHQKLISMINALFDAMSQGESREVVQKILSALIIYTDKHFKYEEQLFRLYGYPDADEHIRQHAELIRQVEELNEKISSHTSLLSIELLKFLKTWLTDHIQNTDKQYSEFLHSKGVR